MPSSAPHSPLRRFRVATALATLLLFAAPAPAEQLPFDTRGNARVVGGISVVGDTDAYGVDLLPGDKVICRVREAGPARGISATLGFRLPNGSDAGASIQRQGSFRPSFVFIADTPGTHQLTVAGDPGGFAGSTGNYSVFLVVRRFRQRPAVFRDVDGGDISFRFYAVDGSRATIRAGTRRGGFTLTELTRPDMTPDPDFPTSLRTARRGRRARLPRYLLTGGTGEYRVRGTYEPRSRVRVSVAIRPPRERARGRLADEEPDFDQFIAPFPREGIAGTSITIVGENLVIAETRRGPVLPTFSVGGIAVDPSVVERPGQLDGVYRFPAPAGLATGEWHDLILRNPDGQPAIARDAFFMVPEPVATGMTPGESGPAGGRTLTITGQNLRGGSVVFFDDAIVQPNLASPEALEVTAPPHAPGMVTLRLRDEFGQTADVPGELTYLDVPSNRIDSITPSFIQALGGETISVHGVDFGTDSVLSLGGVDLDFVRASSALLTFGTEAREAATLDLSVVDDLEQTSTLVVDVRGLTDGSAGIIPAPRTDSQDIDGWRATVILSGDLDGVNGDDLVLFRPAEAFGGSLHRSRLRVLLADGNGAFTDVTADNTPPITAVDDYRAQGATLIDADGDQDLDIAFITTAKLDGGDRSSLRLFVNDGDAVFTDGTVAAMPDARLTIEDGLVLDHNHGVAVVAADVDGINGDDLLILHTDFFQEVEILGEPSEDPEDPPPETATYFYPGLRVLLNDGEGHFDRDDGALPDFDDEDVTQFQGDALGVSDPDGDEDPDVLITRDRVIEFPADSGTFVLTATLLRNDGGTFVDDSVARLPPASNPDFLHGDRIVFVDSDGDGDEDLWVLQNTSLVNQITGAVSTDPAARLYVNTGGVFSRAGSTVLPAADGKDTLQCEDLAVGDLNGDGELDVVLLSAAAPDAGERAMRILRGTSTGDFVRATPALPDPILVDDGRGTTLLLLDIDDDGDLDVVFGRDQPDESVRNTRVFVNPR